MSDRRSVTILLSDKAPFALSILIAASGWFITHFVERIEHSPTIEYQLILEKLDSEKTKLTVKLHNLSLSKSFENSTFLLRKADPADKSFNFLSDAQSQVLPHAPAWVGQELSPDVSPEAAQFKIQFLPPDGRVDLIAFCKGVCTRVAFQGRPAHRTAMRLTERTWETYFVRHELRSFFGCAVFITMAVSIALLRLHRGGSRKDVEDESS